MGSHCNFFCKEPNYLLFKSVMHRCTIPSYENDYQVDREKMSSEFPQNRATMPKESLDHGQ